MILFILTLFIFGLFVGSFLNVVIDRSARGEGFINGRSHCDRCGHVLSWYDLIPLLSYALLQGKCRYCHKSIGYEYPIVETATAISFAVLPFLLSTYDMFLFGVKLLLIGIFIIIFFADLWYGIIPDVALIAGSGGLAMLFFLQPSIILSHVAAGLGAGLFFLMLFLGTKGKGMGFGDVKLALFLGLLLGFPDIIVGLYIAFLTGALVALILILWRKKRLRGDTIPFGPFLVLGGLVAWFWGTSLWGLIARYLLHLQ